LILRLYNQDIQTDRPLSLRSVNVNHSLARGFSARLVIIPSHVSSEIFAEGVDIKPQILILGRNILFS
jgi:hypothetical protein